MKALDIKKIVTKDALIDAYLKAYNINGRSPRFMRLSMQEALNSLGITNSTIKTSTHTLESLLQWIDA